MIEKVVILMSDPKDTLVELARALKGQKVEVVAADTALMTAMLGSGMRLVCPCCRESTLVVLDPTFYWGEQMTATVVERLLADGLTGPVVFLKQPGFARPPNSCVLAPAQETLVDCVARAIHAHDSLVAGNRPAVH